MRKETDIRVIKPEWEIKLHDLASDQSVVIPCNGEDDGRSPFWRLDRILRPEFRRQQALPPDECLKREDAVLAVESPNKQVRYIAADFAQLDELREITGLPLNAGVAAGAEAWLG